MWIEPELSAGNLGCAYGVPYAGMETRRASPAAETSPHVTYCSGRAHYRGSADLRRR